MLTLALSLAMLPLQGLPHRPTLRLTGRPYQLYALSTRLAGDVDADGRGDILAYALNNGSGPGGAVYVHSGRDGALLHRLGPASSSGFSSVPMDGAGDVDGDGHDDVLVGDALQSRATVYSGADGSVLLLLQALPSDDGFGGSVRGVGDVDGDGRDDVLVGTSSADVGYAVVYAGADGSVLHGFRGKEQGDRFGASLAAVGDVNADGHVDFAVGALGEGRGYLHPGFPPFVPPFWTDNDCGGVSVFSGLDGSELYTVLGRAQDDGFGFSLDGVGDVNGDGFDDLVIGSQSTEMAPPVPGYAQVLSGIDGSVLFTFLDDPVLLHSMVVVSGAGDLDGDSVPDVLIGARVVPHHDAIDAQVFSGSSGARVFRYQAQDGLPLGLISVDGARDVDGDGIDDFLIGVAQMAFGAGYAQLYRSGP